MINQSVIKELFEYKNGGLYWKVFTNSRAPIGSKAGTFNKHNDRWYIRVNRVRYLEHRLIFLWHHGWMPEQVDHIDVCRTNNSIENLRAATANQNQRNKPLQCNNTSGAKNVRFHAGKWKVDLKVNKKLIHIGRFDNFELAELVAVEARNKYHGRFANHE
jgi:hypothetical protein